MSSWRPASSVRKRAIDPPSFRVDSSRGRRSRNIHHIWAAFKKIEQIEKTFLSLIFFLFFASDNDT